MSETESDALRQAFLDHGQSVGIQFSEVPRDTPIAEVRTCMQVHHQYSTQYSYGVSTPLTDFTRVQDWSKSLVLVQASPTPYPPNTLSIFIYGHKFVPDHTLPIQYQYFILGGHGLYFTVHCSHYLSYGVFCVQLANPGVPYFMVEFDGGGSLFTRIKGKFPLQFGRYSLYIYSVL